MPRNARVVISNYPRHIIQRGHNRQVVFASDEDERNLALLMRRISGRQTRYLNYIEKRTGTLWEGRYKSSPISTDEYLLSRCRYVELNPVRAGIVPAPEDYRWSSYGEKVGLTKEESLDFAPFYSSLASVQTERQEKYKEFVMGTIPEEEFGQIRQAIQRGQLTGGERFVEEIEVKVGRRIEFRGQGRPRKSRK